MTIQDFQTFVGIWMNVCFGDPAPPIESPRRVYRFCEEALELVQSAGMTKSECLQMIEYVYDRPIGDLEDEIGGTMTTLAALCYDRNLSLDKCSNLGLMKIFMKIDKIRQKHRTVSENSPLPGTAKD